jgi:hypothetical protein
MIDLALTNQRIMDLFEKGFFVSVHTVGRMFRGEDPISALHVKRDGDGVFFYSIHFRSGKDAPYRKQDWVNVYGSIHKAWSNIHEIDRLLGDDEHHAFECGYGQHFTVIVTRAGFVLEI